MSWPDQEVGEVLVTAEELSARVEALGRELTLDYEGKPLTLVGVLKGAAVFMADLARHISLPLELDFMGVSSYGAGVQSSGVVRITKDLDSPIAGKDVLVVEDIVDTGLTLGYILRHLELRRPASLKVCALLVKDKSRQPVPLDYVGFRIPDVFVVGYGLDYGERYRNLPYVAALAYRPGGP